MSLVRKGWATVHRWMHRDGRAENRHKGIGPVKPTQLDSRYYYFNDGRSLCGKQKHAGPYDDTTQGRTKIDCGNCWRVLFVRQKRVQEAGGDR